MKKPTMKKGIKGGGLASVRKPPMMGSAQMPPMGDNDGDEGFKRGGKVKKGKKC